MTRRGDMTDDELQRIHSKCSPLLDKLRSADDEEVRRSTAVALNYCMGSVLCANEAAAFMTTLERNEAAGTMGQSGGEEEAAFVAMTQCLARRMGAQKLA